MNNAMLGRLYPAWLQSNCIALEDEGSLPWDKKTLLSSLYLPLPRGEQ